MTDAGPLSLDGEEEIELFNSLSEPSTRSVIRQVEAFKSASEVDVNFLCDLGTINIIIYDESDNMVYQENVDASAKRHLSIDISNWDQGSYEIQLIDADDHFMYGEFEII